MWSLESDQGNSESRLLKITMCLWYFGSPDTQDSRGGISVLIGKVQEMVGDGVGIEPITRNLFCGSYFPASHNYTREYLQSHPFIQTFFLLLGVDINAATQHGIKVARIPSDSAGNATSCAEMAIYLMFCLLRKQYDMQIPVQQKKLGEPIVGHTAGANASYVANGTYDDLVDEKGGREDILKFANHADIVVCSLAMNSETVRVLYRGGLLDYDAVIHHLKSSHLGGVGIDVAWTEPFDPDNAILKFPNVIIRVAGVTEYSYRQKAKVGGDVALQFNRGKSLTGIEIVDQLKPYI
ncbi:D-isomer specific 2-hydroxyacid dehydrogenase family protein [Abeliophyllum distichum]|uniref:D-isomer specific 2-hydroxyacid dehydrogenase family protein n=1 Tax=Abeliophyllum distichum TaxID=126358 RepID=A0ABD1TKN1_9LAMI